MGYQSILYYYSKNNHFNLLTDLFNTAYDDTDQKVKRKEKIHLMQILLRTSDKLCGMNKTEQFSANTGSKIFGEFIN